MLQKAELIGIYGADNGKWSKIAENCIEYIWIADNSKGYKGGKLHWLYSIRYNHVLWGIDVYK